MDCVSTDPNFLSRGETTDCLASFVSWILSTRAENTNEVKSSKAYLHYSCSCVKRESSFSPIWRNDLAWPLQSSLRPLWTSSSVSTPSSLSPEDSIQNTINEAGTRIRRERGRLYPTTILVALFFLHDKSIRLIQQDGYQPHDSTTAFFPLRLAPKSGLYYRWLECLWRRVSRDQGCPHRSFPRSMRLVSM